MHPWLEKIAGVRILVIGDVMLDRYYFADVTRISPEGPVPVAQVKETETCSAARQCSAQFGATGLQGIHRRRQRR